MQSKVDLFDTFCEKLAMRAGHSNGITDGPLAGHDGFRAAAQIPAGLQGGATRVPSNDVIQQDLQRKELPLVDSVAGRTISAKDGSTLVHASVPAGANPHVDDYGRPLSPQAQAPAGRRESDLVNKPHSSRKDRCNASL